MAASDFRDDALAAAASQTALELQAKGKRGV